jgi:hypothetical protein
MVGENEKKLILLLAEVSKNKNFIEAIWSTLKTEDDKRKMIKFLEEEKRKEKKLSMSDVYIKELEITKEIKLESGN